MSNKRVTQTEYVVRVSVPKSTHAMYVKHCSQFSKSISYSIRKAILAAARKALREDIKAGRLDKAFKVSVH